MNPLLLRQIWATVSNSSFNLLELNNNEITHTILNQIHSDLELSTEESEVMQRYLQSKMPLIRGLLESNAFGES